MRDSEFSYVGTELDAMAGARNYYEAILDRFGPHLGRRVVEVGAGIGSFSERLLGHPGVERAVLMEPDATHVARLRGRFGGDPRVEIVEGFLEAWGPRGSADSMVLINVLEHVEDDAALLRAARERLAPGGRILLFVPALPAITGSLDEAFGHFRRYTAAGLRTRLQAAGFRVADLRYVNFPGILSWFVAGRLLRKRTLSASDVRLYDRWVVPWVSRIEKVIPPPSGQSLLAIARRGDV